MGKVMISYSRKDVSFVEQLDRDLRAAGVDVWLDTRDILPGTAWREEIFRAIPACDAIILCVSKAYVASEMCQSEVFLARCYQKRLLPLALEWCPEALAAEQATKGLENLQMFLVESDLGLLGIPFPYEVMIERLIQDMSISQIEVTENLVYIAFPGEEGVFATKIADDLCQAGIPTWIPTRDSILGLDWQQQQWQAMMNACVMLVILTPDSAESESIKHQILFAKTRNLPIIPIVPGTLADDVANELPRILDDNYENRLINERNWLYVRPDYATMFTELKAAIQRIMERGENE